MTNMPCSFPMVWHGFLMVSYGSIGFMCLSKVSCQNPPYALWPRIVVSAPNIMRELCGNHTLSLSEAFHHLPSFAAYHQLPNLFPTSHPFPSFPPSPPRLAHFPIDFILISKRFGMEFNWFPIDFLKVWQGINWFPFRFGKEFDEFSIDF